MSSEKHFWCQLCGQETAQGDVTSVAQIAGVTNRTIYLWAKKGRVHVNRADDGQLRICQASLNLTTKYVSPPPSNGSIDARVKLVIRLVEQQYERDDPTLSKMAKHAGLSIWYLARLFKKNTGIHFGEYLRNLRLKKAEHLLRDTMLSIKEIAAAVGYKHVSDFDHHFKSTYSMRPGEYRRSQQMRE
jgi:transcriptional regulator GlxA family with amidase domain